MKGVLWTKLSYRPGSKVIFLKLTAPSLKVMKGLRQTCDTWEKSIWRYSTFIKFMYVDWKETAWVLNWAVSSGDKGNSYGERVKNYFGLGLGGWFSVSLKMCIFQPLHQVKVNGEGIIAGFGCQRRQKIRIQTRVLESGVHGQKDMSSLSLQTQEQTTSAFKHRYQEHAW